MTPNSPHYRVWGAMLDLYGLGCQVSGFEPDCPVLGRHVRLKISARTGHRYTVTDPDPQF